MKTEIFILGILIFIFALFLIILLLRARKREFDSFKVGDIIFYPTVTTFGPTCLEDDEADVVTHIDYYESGEVKLIYTKSGKMLTFLNYFRDDFYGDKND